MPTRSAFNSDAELMRLTAAFGGLLRSIEKTNNGYSVGTPCVQVEFFYKPRHRLAVVYFYFFGCYLRPATGGSGLEIRYGRRKEKSGLTPESRTALFYDLHRIKDHPCLPVFLRGLYCLNFDLAPVERKIGFSLSMHEKLELIAAYNERLAQLSTPEST